MSRQPFIVVIPARYASTRLPGKPLRMLVGKPMLQHVWERGRESDAVEVVIATDDQRIAKAAEAFGADVCMTSAKHLSGSDRIAEVCKIRNWPQHTVIVNLQGDEPTMPSALIDQCAALLEDEAADIGTLASPLLSANDLDNPNIVKVLLDTNNYALIFSRAAIPFARSEQLVGLAGQTALHHHGIYAYRVGALLRMVAAAAPAIELCEQLEQLRALHLGMKIRVGRPATRPGPGVDTEADLQMAEKQLRDGVVLA
ncbi:MAG: 3-deoxy-manno-octulosonate cytidylyltransferase [Gammaproteobacteria bacterium]|nr:3-deoxy-manno-octulosonate cytidylyltransferase [Gammaproteobacteria bacterium]MDH4313502.1 3-deoxy-manno-octulosonate cytidylyltransferase [Gammaproteobacteria bacterium]MDH5213882.1 3-deoxy-manno-octulosonate cytidylyltransferase [Gammaproteobacteria bacterium]MDH5500830.1 3-deoxy-manno-octulosonate cytidylyltransferase [Gammaproteobacteria bacterium]